MRILGISAYYHDSAAALIEDGRIIAAAQEERFSRVKHDPGFPDQAVAYCLTQGDTCLADINYVAFYDKPFLKFERLLETYVAYAPRGFQSFCKAAPVWMREKLFQKDLLTRELRRFDADFDAPGQLLFSEHHQSHAASAFFPSPFDQAIVLTMDGVGEWATTSVAIGSGNRLDVQKEIHFPHSLGLLYSAFTYYTGFKVNSGEYKLMGLAPYGEPRYVQRILDHLIDLKADGSFRLNQSYFNYCTGLTMTGKRFDALFGGPRRMPDEPLAQRHMDIAASIQAVTEEVVLRMTRALVAETGVRKLCLAGGVALNCVANGRILRDGHVDELWVQPAAGDAGGAIGAAYCAYHLHEGRPRITTPKKDAMQGTYLGPSFSQTNIEAALTAAGAVFHVRDESQLLDACVQGMVDGGALGWFQGRMEFGPRALGGRSILADPRSATTQRLLNLKIKYRESFRPFAPAVLREDVGDWFELDADSPYMLLVANVTEQRRLPLAAGHADTAGLDKLGVPRSAIPAVTHVDYSARIQTVDGEFNPRYYALLQRFKAATGCPVLVNTSFNVRSEPIVCTPEDAFRCFMGTEMDLLAIGDCLLLKKEQNPALQLDYREAFELD